MRRRVTWLLVPLAWALACGGRFDRYADGGDGDGAAGSSTGQGGSAPARAGAPGKPGNPGSPGKPGIPASGGTGQVGTGGGVATAGAFSLGGVGIGNNGPGGTFSMGEGGYGCIQDPSACAPGFEPVWSGDGCSYTCYPGPKICYAQQQDYAFFRQELIAKYSTLSCMTDADCGVYYENNACGSGCGISLPNQFIKDFELNLNAYAQANCHPFCPRAPEPPCEPFIPSCWKGYCE